MNCWQSWAEIKHFGIMKPFLSVAHLTLSWKWRHFSLLKAKCTYYWLITMCHAGHQLTGLAATFAMVTWTLACFGPWQVLNLLLFVGTRRFCSARVLEVFLQFAWKLLQSFSVTQCAVLSQCEADVSGFWLNNFWKEKKKTAAANWGYSVAWGTDTKEKQCWTPTMDQKTPRYSSSIMWPPCYICEALERHMPPFLPSAIPGCGVEVQVFLAQSEIVATDQEWNHQILSGFDKNETSPLCPSGEPFPGNLCNQRV